MNKKFITLCVSALLAGGMVTPAFAAYTSTESEYAVTSTILSNGELKSPFYFEIKVNASPNDVDNVSYANESLKATMDTYGITTSGEAISGYSLWKFERHTNENGVFDGYYITNAYGIPLALSKTSTGYEFDREGSIKLFQFYGSNNQQLCAKTADGDVMIYWENNALQAGLQGAEVGKNLAVAVYLPGTKAIAPVDLNSVYGDHFSLQIGYYDKNEYKQYENLQGNVFIGNLYTAGNADLTSTNVDIYRLQGDETFLRNEAGEFLVLLKSKWNIQNTDLDATTNDPLKGYRFATMTAKELGEDLASDEPTVLSYVFRVGGVNGHIKDVDSPLEVAVKIDMEENTSYDAETWAELLVAGVNNESGEKSYYLTTASAAEDETYNPISDEVLDLNIADYTKTTYVRFGVNNYVSPTVFWGAAWNIVRIEDGKTINPGSLAWVAKEEIGQAVPEGQWILREVNKVQAWVNRETGKTATNFPFSGLRSTDEANVYTDGDYTYRITKAVDLADWDRFDYFGLDAKQTSTGVEETYRVTFRSQYGEVYITRDGVGVLHLTDDPTKALRFHVDTMRTTDDAAVVNGIGLNANVDVFDIYNPYMGWDEENEKWVEKTDTVSFHRYNLSYDGKYLNYNKADNKYELVDPVYYTANAGTSYAAEYLDHHYIDAYIIKEKGGDFINILNTVKADYDEILSEGARYANSTTGIDITDDATETTPKRINTPALLACDSTQMMYFDFNFDEARQQQNIYNWVSNAQLQLDYQDYAIYRNVAPYAPDTMAIYRTEFDDEFMYERGEFLGVTYDRNGYNAALFIDTAYVRNNTEKPLFMIGVRPEITPEYVYCPEHGPNAGCPSQHLDTIPGYVDADYLTVLADSAAYHAAELQNPFLDDNAYTKLAFIAARHNVDTITVADSGAKATIVEGMQHPMVFAFRYVDHETGDFIIEGVNLKNNKKEFDAKENPYVTSYIRWNNGVPVMTENINDAEVFNITNLDETADPTANETIAAEGAVSVVATEGGVIVKGAEGKNVVVATILGKVVANETVNSDNETINTPAGIVVVSVDGESFKVVVK